jgi:adenylate cyclase
MRAFRNGLAGVVIGCVAALLAVGALHFGKLEHLEGITFDLRARALARPGPATDDIRIILLDQKSLDWAKEAFGLGWPWPRQAYAPVVDFCRRAGAASLAFDVVYTEPSVYGVADDKALSDAFTAFGKVILAADFANRDGSTSTWPDHVKTPGLTARNQPPAKPAKVATFPIPDLASGAAGVGNVSANPDPDTVYRRIPLLVRFDNTLVPALPLAAKLAARPEPLAFGPGSLAVGKVIIPVSRQGEAVLNYRNIGAYKTYSAAAVMESGLRLADGKASHLALSDFRGKHVFFGFSATGLYDLRPTPMGGVSPGVLVNATALDNLLSGDFMRPLPFELDAVTTILFAVLAGLSVTVIHNLWFTIGASGLALVGPVLFAMVAYRMNIWSGLAVQLTGSLTALFLAGAYKYATEGRRKQFIKSAFRHYLSPQVIDQLLKDPDRLTLGGERRELTIFFSDLEGFTSISEGLSPEELTSVLNDYLTAMTDIIQETGGTVDKYEGDAIIAFWNAPVDQPDHGLRGVTAALRCQEKLAEMRPALKERTGKEFRMRIGLNTGPAVVGNLGSHTRFDYTMLGDSVNLAARLESINKQFGTYTMLSQTTLDQLDNAVPVRELSRLRVVGKSEAVTVFEPLTEADLLLRQDILPHFAKGLELFYAGDFTKAIAYFAVVADTDPASAAYVAKCKELQTIKPANWDGIWTMTRK